MAEDGIRALSEFGAGDEDADATVGAGFEADDGTEIGLSGSGETGAVKESGDANSLFDAAAGICFREGFFFCVITREIESAIEKFRKIDLFTNDLACDGGLAGTEEIAAPNFDGGEANDLRDAVHVALQGEEGLRRAKAAECAVGRRVGSNRSCADAGAGPEVGATGMNRTAGENDGRQSFVGAAVEREINFACDKFAVLADGGADASARRMALGGGGHVFHAVVNYFYGLAGFFGE